MKLTIGCIMSFEWFDFVPKIGVIGLGFVGDAVRQSYTHCGNVICIDTDLSKGHIDTYSDLKDCEAVFVCVPSPSLPDGNCNSSILEEVLNNLWRSGFNGVIISKVTATPSIYERLQSCHKNLVHVPEFLTAQNSVSDYTRTKRFVVGGCIKAYQNEAARIIRLSHPEADIQLCSIGEAALVKYVVNSFLATKVVFMNEMAQLAEASGYTWEKLIRLIAIDERIGPSHMHVPGPDGYRGFGGHCFPKDVSAIIKYAEDLNTHLNVLKEATKKNTLLRLTKT